MTETITYNKTQKISRDIVDLFIEEKIPNKIEELYEKEKKNPDWAFVSEEKKDLQNFLLLIENALTKRESISERDIIHKTIELMVLKGMASIKKELRNKGELKSNVRLTNIQKAYKEEFKLLFKNINEKGTGILKELDTINFKLSEHKNKFYKERNTEQLNLNKQRLRKITSSLKIDISDIEMLSAPELRKRVFEKIKGMSMKNCRERGFDRLMRLQEEYQNSKKELLKK